MFVGDSLLADDAIVQCRGAVLVLMNRIEHASKASEIGGEVVRSADNLAIEFNYTTSQ